MASFAGGASRRPAAMVGEKNHAGMVSARAGRRAGLRAAAAARKREPVWAFVDSRDEGNNKAGPADPVVKVTSIERRRRDRPEFWAGPPAPSAGHKCWHLD